MSRSAGVAEVTQVTDITPELNISAVVNEMKCSERTNFRMKFDRRAANGFFASKSNAG